MATPKDVVIDTIKTWLSSNHAKLERFLETLDGIDWTMWLRYELFVAIKTVMKYEYVNYGLALFERPKMDLDVVVEPSAIGFQDIVVKFRYARICSDFADFGYWVSEMNVAMAEIKKFGVPVPDREGAKLLLVSFRRLPDNQDGAIFNEMDKVQWFAAGNVAFWVMEYDLPYDENNLLDEE